MQTSPQIFWFLVRIRFVVMFLAARCFPHQKQDIEEEVLMLPKSDPTPRRT